MTLERILVVMSDSKKSFKGLACVILFVHEAFKSDFTSFFLSFPAAVGEIPETVR